MTEEVITHPDIDDLPDRGPRSALIDLEESAYIENQADADALGVGENYAKFLKDATGGREIRVLYLRGRGIDVTRSDGQPFYMSDIVKLVIITKSGEVRPATKNQQGGILSARFREFLVEGGEAQGDLPEDGDATTRISVSPNRKGQPNSAVGRIFQTEETEVTLGGGFKKRFSLWPVEMKPAGYVYDGEVREIDVSASPAGTAEAAETPSIPTIRAETLVVEALTGRTPAEMLDGLLGSQALKGVSTLFGVDLLEAATDESLAAILEEAGRMALVDGKLVPLGQPIAEATA